MDETSLSGTKAASTTPTILIPLPDQDFDPTECATPWKVCVSRGWKVTFSTEHGDVAQGDRNLLRGPILGPLGAAPKALAAYKQMTRDPAFQRPVPYADIDPDQYDGLVLPGGHAAGMRQCLESAVLRSKVLQFNRERKLIAAICHGTVVLARTIDPQTGRSVLYGHKVTALPRSIDRAADLLNSRLLRRSYLNSPCYVAEEVRTCLKHPGDLSDGPSLLAPYVVCDGNLITSRWPPDAALFSERFADALEERMHIEKSPESGTR